MKGFLRALLLSAALLPAAVFAAVDINSADAAALEQVKGLGPAKAKAIVAYRQAHGPFANVDDLTKVPGIGEKSLARLRSQLTAGRAAKAAAK